MLVQLAFPDFIALILGHLLMSKIMKDFITRFLRRPVPCLPYFHNSLQPFFWQRFNPRLSSFRRVTNQA
jgi:hypothetical protein